MKDVSFVSVRTSEFRLVLTDLQFVSVTHSKSCDTVLQQNSLEVKFKENEDQQNKSVCCYYGDSQRNDGADGGMKAGEMHKLLNPPAMDDAGEWRLSVVCWSCDPTVNISIL